MNTRQSTTINRVSTNELLDNDSLQKTSVQDDTQDMNSITEAIPNQTLKSIQDSMD